MATVDEEIERLKALKAAGKGGEKVHVVRTELEAKRRRENSGPKPQTRFTLDCDTAHAFRALYIEWDRILTRVKNKGLALYFMTRALHDLTDERIDDWLREGGEQEDEGEIPGWARLD